MSNFANMHDYPDFQWNDLLNVTSDVLCGQEYIPKYLTFRIYFQKKVKF